jgi:ribonuclease T2
VRRDLVLAIAGTAFAIFCPLPTASAISAPSIDHYLLALSWSPTYCGSAPGAGEVLQCGSGRRFAFIVHGLWPQHNRGWPEYCAADEPVVPEESIRDMLPLMPSRNLIIHQWRKHGSCSGLSMGDYFALTKALFSKVRIPARYLSPAAVITTSPSAIVEDFIKSNHGLTPSMISVRCRFRRGQARLTGIDICFALHGGFVACGAEDKRRCTASSLLVPPAREMPKRDWMSRR